MLLRPNVTETKFFFDQMLLDESVLDEMLLSLLDYLQD